MLISPFGFNAVKRKFKAFDFFGGEGVLAGRPTDFNGARLDASLETFLTKKRKNKGRGGVYRE